jgi:hypothetical protein
VLTFPIHPSHLRVKGSPRQYGVPNEGDHDCCRICQECEDCDRCNESKAFDGSPRELHDVIALFPNTTALDVHWEVSDLSDCTLDLIDSGNQLRHVKRLDLSLQPDHLGNWHESQSWQAEDARALLDHLYMPSVESVTIKFNVSEYTRGYLHDFACVREALCRIESPTFQHVTFYETIPIYEDPFTETWVSI